MRFNDVFCVIGFAVRSWYTHRWLNSKEMQNRKGTYLYFTRLLFEAKEIGSLIDACRQNPDLYECRSASILMLKLFRTDMA